MLKKLIVSNLAVVEKAEVEFASGLNVITGETGAGKSVLMGALSLVLGGRADGSLVREGAVEAEVEAWFDEIVIRRTVTAQGKSRAWINEESVTIAELRELGGKLIDIHGPRATSRLLEEGFQREMLDDFGAINLKDYTFAYEKLLAVRARRAALGKPLSEEELDFLKFQVGELEGAELTDEDETIESRHSAAAHHEEIIESANEITEGLGGDRGVAATLAALQPKFVAMTRHFPLAAEWTTVAEDLTLKAQELSRNVADAISRLDASEEDLDALDRRLTLVNKLKRKYKAADVAALLKVLDEKKRRLEENENREEVVKALDAEEAAAEKDVRTAGGKLTKAREVAAEKFAAALQREIKALGFLQAKFSILVEPGEMTASGLDRITYLFEPNPGETARPLAAIASSGEIARVMLAIKVVTSRADLSRTLVFDEIDANIGGEVGAIVGEKMRAVAGRHQVIAITHLPQSAVFGERHLVVQKGVHGGRTRTEVKAVDGTERILEVARMLGGENITSVVKKHAQELLKISR